MSELDHNGQAANPARLCPLFSGDYTSKLPCFRKIRGLRLDSYCRLNRTGFLVFGFRCSAQCCEPRIRASKLVTPGRVGSGAAKQGRAKPSEPGRAKTIRMSGVGYNGRGANPARLCPSFSRDYARKLPCFRKIRGLRCDSYLQIASSGQFSGSGFRNSGYDCESRIANPESRTPKPRTPNAERRL